MADERMHDGQAGPDRRLSWAVADDTAGDGQRRSWAAADPRPAAPAPERPPERRDEQRLPVVEERLHVGKRLVETDRVRVRTVVDVDHEEVDALLEVGRLDVARVAVDREVAQAPAPWQDGDTLVIPLVEERLVKRLFVVEELRVTRTAHQERATATVPLRRTRAVVERPDAPESTKSEFNRRND